MPTFKTTIRDRQILQSVSLVVDHEEFWFQALLDTGAQGTLISPKVVEQTGLKPISYTHIMPASGNPVRTRKYRTDVGMIEADGGMTSARAGETLEVAELPFQPDNFYVLLGMDYLTKFHFTMYDDVCILSI